MSPLTFKEFRVKLAETSTYRNPKIQVIGAHYKPGSYADLLYKKLMLQFNGKELDGLYSMQDLLKKIDLLGFKVITLDKNQFMFGSPDDFIIKVNYDSETNKLTMIAGTGSDLVPSKTDPVMHIVSKVDRIIPGTFGDYIFKQLVKVFDGKPILDESKFLYTLKTLAFANYKVMQNADGSFGFAGVGSYPPLFNCKIYFNKEGTVTLYSGTNFNKKPEKEAAAPSKAQLDYVKAGGMKGAYKITSRNFFNN